MIAELNGAVKDRAPALKLNLNRQHRLKPRQPAPYMPEIQDSLWVMDDADNGDEPPIYGQSALNRMDLVPFVKWLLRRHQRCGGVTEIRAIAEVPAKQIWSGYYDPQHWEQLVEQIQPDRDGPRQKIPYGDSPRIGEANFYFTLQPVNPALLARSANKLGRCPATSDSDIIAYQLFPADVDPRRPAGISATDKEKRHARKVAVKIAKWFQTRGINPIWADSGNGYHLLIPTITYQDVAAAAANAQTLLQLLAKQFSTPEADVDTTVYNAGRIFKLYGTVACKGSDLPERPHRYAGINMAGIRDDIDLFEIVKDDLAAFRKAAGSTQKPVNTSGTKTAAKTPKKDGSPKSHAAGGGGGADSWDAETSTQVLKAVMEKSGLEFRIKLKEGKAVFEFRDCPLHSDPDGDHYECCVIVRSDGKFAGKCQHEAEAGWQDFKPLIGWNEHIGEVCDELGIIRRASVPYKATAHGLVRFSRNKEDVVITIPLTNFTARIVNDIQEDDGVETRHTFEIEAELHGRSKQFLVPAQEFVGMNWPIEQLGAEAVVFPGQANKDHARTAIQLLAGAIPTETVYTHLGWRKHDGKWVYLHAGGAIGASGSVEGLRVQLSEPFTRFELPSPRSKAEQRKGIRASLKLLGLAPDSITIPLFAGIWRAAVGGTDFSQFLVGPTGNFKSELASLLQQHWGAGLDARNVPASWSSTANANEALAFIGKDAVLLIDDFAPHGSQADVQKAHRDADRLLRGQGNQSGRGRMRADTTLRPPKPPRGMIVGTGEEIPRGQSLQARIFVHEISPGTVNVERLTECQMDAAEGLYALALAGFVRWLAGRYQWVRRYRAKKVRKYRAEAAQSDQHRRTPAIVGELYVGLDLFRRYAEHCGAMDQKEGRKFLKRCWKALGHAATKQTSFQTTSNPVQRFLDLLRAAVAAGKAHVASTAGTEPKHPECWGWRRQDYDWVSRGDRVGWVDDNDLYLEPEAAYTVVQQMAQASGNPLTLSSATLRKRLYEKHLLVTKDKRGRLTIRKSLEGRMRPVLHLRARVLGAVGVDEKAASCGKNVHLKSAKNTGKKGI